MYRHSQYKKEKWVAEGHFTEEGINKKKYLGVFDTKEDAYNARKEWNLRQGNFTDRHGL